MAKENEEYVRGRIKQAQAEHLAEAKQRYQSWLEGAQVKGMRPLYKAIRSHEQVLVRPFRDKEAALRPYLRYHQWQEIWKSQTKPVDPVVPELLSRAVKEAASLPAITAAQLQTKFHCLPEKVAVATGRHRATVYLDLTTFYETLAHSRLIASAQELAFPASLLNIAIQIYRGARIIDAEGTMSPVSYTGCGVVAGCPVAPALSKLALYRPCRAVQNTSLLAGLDTWIDDVSIDAEDADAQRAAQKIVALYRTIREEIGNAELLISASKSAFVCTNRHTQHRLKQLLLPGEPPVLHLVKDLGVDSAGARRRRVATSNARISKAACRSGKLTRLRIPNPKKRAQIAATGVETAATFGHQGQGISPKRMKVLRAIAGGHYGKLSFGSLDLIFDLSHVGSGDPLHKIVLEHWAMLRECVVRNLPAAELVRRTWAVSWAKISRSPQRWTIATGPIGAMQCYLLDMGFEAPTMDIWKRADGDIALNWGSPSAGKEVGFLLQKALLKDRWERIALQENAGGAQEGIDWTERYAGPTMVVTPFAAGVDIGPDPVWKTLYPDAPECFGVRGMVPKQSTMHPALALSQMAVRKEGIFTGEFLPGEAIFFGTD
ncbi:unnamed protein product, partial [Symbiodinium sp. CCMP2456]